MRAGWTAALIAAISPTAPAQVRGAEPARVHLVGAARMNGSRIRLTPAVGEVSGAAWISGKQPASGGFEFEFQFQLTQQGGLGRGADGLAFVIQNQGVDALAGRGGAAGFALGDGYGDKSKPGIPHSIAVFLDTYRNPDAGDPSDNYIAICTNGPVQNMRWPAPRLGISRKLKVSLKDGRVHTVRVLYAPPLMSVHLDGGEPVIRVPVDLSTVVDSSGTAYLGFTAATGSGYQNHDVLEWSFKSTRVDTFMVQSDVSYLPPNCLPGRNLCTPADAVIEDQGPGLFHIVLPPQAAWSASIPNPDGRTVVVKNVRGSVCFGGKNNEVGDCGGPDGFGTAPGPLLAPDRAAGALVQKTEHGRTWFSVNDSAHGGFSRNQGFFEFDARLQ